MSPRVLVVGAGLAGLRAAIAAAETGARVRVVSKVHPLSSHSVAATGGINVALLPGDVPEHVEDTLRDGGYLGDRDAVEKLCSQAGDDVRVLESWGVPFDRGSDERLGVKSLAGSAKARTVYVGNHTGRAMLQAIWQRAMAAGIEVVADCMLVDLVLESDLCRGGVFLDLGSGELSTAEADATVLATGGLGQLYRPTTNAVICTGDGTAAAFRAGATLVDMEMTQFYPACFPSHGVCVTEELRAHGARFINNESEYFMERYDPVCRDMAGRDALSRALYQERAEGREVFLDCRRVPRELLEGPLAAFVALSRRFEGVEPSQDCLPVVPGMHYHMGGIRTDLDGRTSIEGLFAAGECACLSVHGANRIGGNGLLEAIVMGRIAGSAAAASALSDVRSTDAHSKVMEHRAEEARAMLVGDARAAGGGDELICLRETLGAQMMANAGIIREERSLREGLDTVVGLERTHRSLPAGEYGRRFNQQGRRWLEMRNLLSLAAVVIRSALWRCESRGAHQRADFPTTGDDPRHTLVRTGASGQWFFEAVASRS